MNPKQQYPQPLSQGSILNLNVQSPPSRQATGDELTNLIAFKDATQMSQLQNISIEPPEISSPVNFVKWLVSTPQTSPPILDLARDVALDIEFGWAPQEGGISDLLARLIEKDACAEARGAMWDAYLIFLDGKPLNPFG